jgi:hypothetical protein
MKIFQPIAFDPDQCRRELSEFETLLRAKESLGEKSDILPFFKSRQHLSALIGCYHPNIVNPSRVAHEFDIFGGFRADLAIGDPQRRAYCLVEFENAAPDSIFVTTERATTEWSPRFEHGFGQIVDWFWRISDYEKSDEFEGVFDSRTIDHMAVLVVGRSSYLDKREKSRLEWRRKRIIVDSQKVFCYTFDELFEDLSFRLQQYPLTAAAERAPEPST